MGKTGRRPKSEERCESGQGEALSEERMCGQVAIYDVKWRDGMPVRPKVLGYMEHIDQELPLGLFADIVNRPGDLIDTLGG